MTDQNCKRDLQHPAHLVVFPPPLLEAAVEEQVEQCRELAQRFGLVHLVMSEILRHNVEQCTELGDIVSECEEEETPIPSDVLVHMIKQRIAENDCTQRGWLLENFPCTGAAATCGLLDAVLQLRILCSGICLLRILGCAIRFPWLRHSVALRFQIPLRHYGAMGTEHACAAEDAKSFVSSGILVHRAIVFDLCSEFEVGCQMCVANLLDTG